MDGSTDITDLSVLIDNQFLTLTPLPCWGEADMDGNYDVDITDLMMLVEANFMCCFGNCFPLCVPPPASGTMLPLTGCKTEGAATAASDSVSESCIVWAYDGQSRLALQHVNAGLNCCPEGQAEITISEGLITVDESVINGLCDCYCLFDVDMVVANLPPGEYTFVVNEPLLYNPGETFEFTVDLNAEPTGMVCIERNLYPWGAY